MRAANLDAVAAVLDRTPVPLSAKRIAEMTGLSSHTVAVALAELRAVADRNWPKGWSANPDPVDTQVSLATEGKPTVAVDRRPDDPSKSWVQRWEYSRPAIMTELMKLDIRAKADPKELVEVFHIAASSLASIGAAIQEVQDDPDWYAKLSEYDV